MDYKIRPAALKDIEKIRRLIDVYAAKKIMLKRTKAFLKKSINNYVVATSGSKFVGVCGLRLWQPNLLEVISLAVGPKYKNQGVGTALIREAINQGIKRGYNSFFTLTMSPKIFKRLGFKKISFKKISPKVQSDCNFCPKNDAGPGKGSCNEIPLSLITPK